MSHDPTVPHAPRESGPTLPSADPLTAAKSWWLGAPRRPGGGSAEVVVAIAPGSEFRLAVTGYDDARRRAVR
ncbi:hypothetical protein [Nocardia barduliensis]|uniref:hypothetical protein n=1 Tax=Nocardia barduliensis TaxID=2736643 RepID=UPI0015720488|nr:hypothetical protein [Nocardia barduliensis]